MHSAPPPDSLPPKRERDITFVEAERLRSKWSQINKLSRLESWMQTLIAGLRYDTRERSNKTMEQLNAQIEQKKYCPKE